MFKVFFDDMICGAGAGGWGDQPIIRVRTAKSLFPWDEIRPVLPSDPIGIKE